MTLSMHAASVPVFQQMLAALGAILAKAETHAAERKIEPAALLQSRLFPDRHNIRATSCNIRTPAIPLQLWVS